MISPASRFIRCINSRAVVDLPQPDSPTIPTVSPLAMANDTSSTAHTVLRLLNRSPRTGKCFVSPLTCSNGCAAPPRSSIGSSNSTCGLISFMTSVPDVHGAAHAVAKQVEADRHREDHRHRDQPGGVNENRPQHVAEHVHAHDGEGAGAGGPRRLDEIHVAHAGGDALGNAGNLRHEYHRQ